MVNPVIREYLSIKDEINLQDPISTSKGKINCSNNTKNRNASEN